MTITELRYFEAVCIYKSISRAAEFLHISQPSLSAAIKGLEDEFRVTLFQRRHRGVVPTAEGEALYKSCRELLSSFDDACSMMRELGGGRQTIRIGVPPMIGSLILPRLCGELIAERPDLTLSVTEGGSRELERRLAEGQLDMVFLTHTEELPEWTDSISVADMEVVLCVAEGDALSELGAVSPLDLAESALVLFSSAFYQTELIKKQFSDAGIKPKIILETEQLSTAMSLIESGSAAGFMFKELVGGRRGITTIPLKEKILVKISLARRNDAYLTDAMRALSAFIKGCGGKLTR